MNPQTYCSTSRGTLLWLVWSVVSCRCLVPVFSQPALERQILTSFYDTTGGNSWKTKTGWKKASVPICSWYGIVCAGPKTSNQGVVNITLSNNNLNGRIPKLLYSLPNLTAVNLRENPGLTNGGFDGFSAAGSSKRLKILQLSQCGLTTLAGIGHAPPSLKELNLTENALRGQFPPELTNLTKLEKLYLNFNEISGPLPTTIGRMVSLTDFFMYQNKLNGQLPSQLGLLVHMQVFTLAENKLGGTLPSAINAMRSLKTFSIHNRIPAAGNLVGPLIEFSNMPFLSELYLDGNNLSGTIPSTFLLNIRNVNRLVSIGLSNNNLVGTIPAALGRFQSLNLDLVNNSITGIPASLCAKDQWMNGLVGQYGCNAILCPAGTYNSGGRQVSNSSPCRPCPTSTLYGQTSCKGTKRPTRRPMRKPSR